jgi:hypothetical protein
LNNETSIISSTFSQTYSKLSDLKADKGSIILMYDGVLNSDTISKLESLIEERLFELNLPKSVHKKAFFISVELLQNLLLHGHKDPAGIQHQFIIISKTSDKLIITTSNLITNSHIPKIQEILDSINAINDPTELKMFYMSKLESGELSEKGGAGLGFITIAMKSGNKLSYEFQKITDDFSLFFLETSIDLNA